MSPTPQIIPQNAADLQQLQLLGQIQQHLLSNTEVFLLYLAMLLPLPVSWRLNFYYWVTSFPLPHLSPTAITILMVIGPFLLVLFVFLLFQLILGVLRRGIPFVFSLFIKGDHQKVFLELTFPADTGKSAYATEQFFNLLNTLSRQMTWWDRLRQWKNEYAFELVSTKQGGIRYILASPVKYEDIVSRNLLSYLPGIKITKVQDYFGTTLTEQPKHSVELKDLKLSSHFALPLEDQKTLTQHDPISYLTGNMTTLTSGDVVALQIVVSPVVSTIHRNLVSEMKTLEQRLYKGLPLTEAIQKNPFERFVALPGISLVWLVILGVWKLISFSIMFVFSMVMAFVDSTGKSVPFLMTQPVVVPQDILNPYERELATIIKTKIDQPLFETSIRLLVVSDTRYETQTRMSGLIASFGQMSSAYQSLVSKSSLFPAIKKKLSQYAGRTLSPNTPLNQNPILSSSELADIYHFPYTETTKTEGFVKVHSKELPVPLAVKNATNFDVTFGKNTYGNNSVDIGLTDEDRSRHVYIIGQTGSGKTTVMFHMAKDDIQKGRGVAIIDPHGDLAEDLLSTIPQGRINDCIYFNPYDIRYPIGINLLELTSGLGDDDLEQEKELVCEGVISIFRRVFNKDENTDAHRIEYILRNAIYTAFTVKNVTIFTVYDLLTDPSYQKKVTKTLEDDHLRNFWKNEFGRAGNYQVIKMVSGVTAKVGRFLFSPSARRILEQPRSTIHFDEILSSEKILICNLAEGKLGEDTSQLLGTTILAKIQQAAVRRVRPDSRVRKPFYVFIDEFQNFATPYFSKLLSGGRKFGLRLTIAEQSTAQQDDRNLVNVILANTGTTICFRTASPIDEAILLAQLSPYVERTDIVNLPRYHFFMKLSAVEPEEPFSGITFPIVLKHNQNMVERIIAASRKNFAIQYKRQVKKVINKVQKKETNTNAVKEKSGLPQKS